MQDERQHDGTTRAYQDWLHERHGGAQARRTAQRNAAFLLPHLRPGMRVLDAGCGPGSITLGLADTVGAGGADARGEVVGIDVSAAAIATARAAAAERGATGMRFEVADVYALPFADASFDAAFSHAMLQHLADPLAALREIRRVLKPNAVIGVADADLSGSVIYPATPALNRSLDLMVRLRLHDGGTPDAGRRLRSLLSEAGFSRNAGMAIADADAAAETTARTGAFWASYFDAAPLVAHVAATGLATAGDLAEMAAAWRTWGSEPGAFWARFWCQAVGWVDAEPSR